MDTRDLTIFQLASVSLALMAAPAGAAVPDCAETFVTQGAADSSCSQLRVELDTTSCPGGGDRVAAKLECESAERAEARATIHGVEHSVVLRRVAGKWRAEVAPTSSALPAAEHAASPDGEHPAEKEHGEAKGPAPAFAWNAYFDGHYGYNFNRPPTTAVAQSTPGSSALPPPQNSLRFYDWYTHSFDLNLVELTVKASRKETSLLVDFDFGQNADINSAAAIPGTSGYLVDELSKHIGQAVFSYNPASAPRWTFEFGKLPTHLGLEVTKAKENWNYSRSILFSFGIPLWHIGAHVGYAIVPEALTVSGYLYNGWNTVYAANSQPTLGGQLKLFHGESFLAMYNFIGGPEQAGNLANQKQVHEFAVSGALTSALSAGFDAIAGREQGALSDGSTATWTAAQAGIKLQLGEKSYLSPRVEAYRDSQGYTLGSKMPETAWSYTLTHSVMLSDGLELRTEARTDRSTQTRFITRDGTSRVAQTTLLLGILYSL